MMVWELLTMPKSPPKLDFQKPKTHQTDQRPDRVGKRLLQCHLPEEISTEMRVLAARQRTTVTALIEEAIADLFTKYQHKLAR
jgi:hypothetical protein